PHYATRGAEQSHGAADHLWRHGPHTQAVLDALGELLEHVGIMRFLAGVLRLEELDVIEHLVDLLLRQRFDAPPDPLFQYVVHPPLLALTTTIAAPSRPRTPYARPRGGVAEGAPGRVC